MANTTYKVENIDGYIHIYPQMEDCYCDGGKHYPLNEVGVRETKTCPRCDGAKWQAVKATLCSHVPDGFMEDMVQSGRIGIRFNYNGDERFDHYSASNCLWSCGDYGRWKKNDNYRTEIRKDIVRDKMVQFGKVVRDSDNRLCDWIEVRMMDFGYDVYGVWNKENSMFTEKLVRLKNEAEEACNFRGHKLHYWRNHPDGSSTNLCYMCKKEVIVRTQPRPNEINVGGEALALDCND